MICNWDAVAAIDTIMAAVVGMRFMQHESVLSMMRQIRWL